MNTGRGRRLPAAVLPWLTVLALLVVLELLTRSDALPQRFFPPPTRLAPELGTQLLSSRLWLALWQTLYSWALSLLAAGVLAIPAGIAIGSSVTLHRALRFVIEYLRPIPSVALIPAVILVIGVGVESKILLAAFAAFWPILIQAVYGVQDVEPVAMDTARSFGFGAGQRLVFVTLPSAVPYIATGLRIASAVALIVVITMEIVVGIPGIGLSILNARQGANVEAAYALILAAGLLGWLLNTGFAVAERRVLHWHPSHREVVR